MHYSGILVSVVPQRFEESVLELERIPGVEVFHADPERGRLVAVQETPTVQGQEAGFTRIGSLPHVLAVELVYHYRDGAPDPPGIAGGRGPRDPKRKEAQP